MVFFFENSILSVGLLFPVLTCCQRMHFIAQHFDKYSTSVSKDIGYQPAFTCSKLTIETVEQGVTYVQVNNKNTSTTPTGN